MQSLPRIVPLLATVPLLAACGATETPMPREVPTYTIEQFMGTTALVGASFSPDSQKILVSSDATGIPNVYAFPVEGGEPVQLTHSTDDAINVIGYFPADERFLYATDEGGNELSHIYVHNPDGTVRDLTPGEGLRASFAGWSADDRSFFFKTNERDPRYMDLYEMTLDGYERTLLYRNETGPDVDAISPDRRLLTLVQPIDNNNTDLLLHDRETGETTRVGGLPSFGLTGLYPDRSAFHPDGSSLYFVSNDGSESAYLDRHDLESGERTTVLRLEQDVLFNLSFSPTGRYLVAGVFDDARLQNRVFETATMERIHLPLEDGYPFVLLTTDFSPDEERLAFYAISGRRPANLHVYSFADGIARKLNRTLNPAIEVDHLVRPEVVRFDSYDGLEIPGLLYRPHSASSDAPMPTLIWIHGGPGWASIVAYDPFLQYLVNHGYAIYAINNRGSDGYGKTFSAADDRRHGEADLDDVVASKRMLIETGWVDPERIGVAGASYGGYLTMAALAFRPDEFAVGVDIFGVTNWIRTLENIPPWWESGRDALYGELGDPATDRERFRRISPLFHADNITKPFIVLQGANDPRVLQVESDEIVAAAEANGVPVEYIVFPDEGHGILKKENKIRGYEAILGFLDRYLKEGDATASTDG